MIAAHVVTPARIEALHAIRDRLPGNAGAAQRSRMRAALHELGSITTFEAMRYLDVFDPRPRIFELRGDGLNITTVREDHFTEANVRHRLGRYVLVRGVANA